MATIDLIERRTDVSSYLDTFDQLPFSYYEQMRSRGDVVWDERFGSWVVVGFEAAKSVLMDVDTFAQIHGSTNAAPYYKKIRSDNPRSMQFVSPEVHKAFRKWWLTDILSAAESRRYKNEYVEPWIDTLLGGLADRTEFDFCEEIADRVPMGVFAGILDLPDRSLPYLDHVKALNDALAGFSTAANAGLLENELNARTRPIVDAAIAAAEELNGILLPLVNDRRNGIGDDFISRLWRGGPSIFEDWNEIDTLDACRRLLFAGVDTTTHALSNAFYVMLTTDGLFERLRDDDTLIEPYVEEILRLHGSVQFRPRRAVRECVIAGVTIPEGSPVTVMLLAANRDPAKFEDPNAVRLDRKQLRDHVAFSTGTRTCLGAHLARGELNSVIRATLARFPSMRLAQPPEAAEYLGFLMRSFRPINVRVDSRL